MSLKAGFHVGSICCTMQRRAPYSDCTSLHASRLDWLGLGLGLANPNPSPHPHPHANPNPNPNPNLVVLEHTHTAEALRAGAGGAPTPADLAHERLEMRSAHGAAQRGLRAPRHDVRHARALRPRAHLPRDLLHLDLRGLALDGEQLCAADAINVRLA